MSRAYDTRPNLETYDALTLRGIAKFAIVIAVLIGVQIAADRFGLGRWLIGLVQLFWIGLGARILWPALKGLRTGDDPVPEESERRYADRGEIKVMSPRAATITNIIVGVLLITAGAARLIQVFSE